MQYIWGFVFLVFTTFSHALSYTQEFTETELQEKIEAMMPLTKKKFLLSIVISEPHLTLLENVNKLGLQTKIEAIVAGGLKGEGNTHITGSIAYNQDEGAFYFKDPTIVSLSINGISEEFQAKIKSLAQKSVAKLLAKHPVFTFKDDNLKHQLAKSTLESVTIKDKKLVITLNLF